MSCEEEKSLEVLLGKGIPQVQNHDEKYKSTKVHDQPNQVEDALLSRLCPKEHTSLALTCRTALVSIHPLSFPFALFTLYPLSDIFFSKLL